MVMLLDRETNLPHRLTDRPATPIAIYTRHAAMPPAVQAIVREAAALPYQSAAGRLGEIVRALMAVVPHEHADMLGEALLLLQRCWVLESQLALCVFRADGSIEDYGIVGRHVVTTAGVNFIVDAFQNSVEVENLKFHGIGTGSTAEATGDTALVTELTTEYNPDNTRATGTTTEGASANIYRTVGTNTLDGTPGAALREHGIFSQAATGGGTLLDRTVYAAITLSSGDGLQSTYDLTCSAGS